MTTPGLAPRRAAVEMIRLVLEDGRLLSEILPSRTARLDPADRARAQRLAVTTLRWMDRADRVLGPYLKKRPDPWTMAVLRLAVVEICLGGQAGHGVVNAAVELAQQDHKGKHMSGLVNAVLRQVAETGPEGWDKLPLPRLPKWLRKPLIADFGKAAVEAMEAAHAAGAALDLTPKDGNADTLAVRVGGVVLPTGSVRLRDAGQVSALPGYEAGDWWVQDAAAALPARVLNAQPGESVLDLCAAPGGKTLQLAAAGAEVTALDISESRMERVRENLGRTGLEARTEVADALEWEGGPYDAVLLDAPCSATGTIRRHPDLPYAKDGSDFPSLFELQEYLIDRALALLKPGGRLVYCTCSLLIDEGEEQVRDALERHPDLTLASDELKLPGVDPEWIDPATGLRLRPDYWPDLGGMDGFFIAVFRKPA